MVVPKFVKAPRIVLWLCVGGEEPVCFAACAGEELGPLGETQVADAATVQKQWPKQLQVERSYKAFCTV